MLVKHRLIAGWLCADGTMAGGRLQVVHRRSRRLFPLPKGVDDHDMRISRHEQAIRRSLEAVNAELEELTDAVRRIEEHAGRSDPAPPATEAASGASPERR